MTGQDVGKSCSVAVVEEIPEQASRTVEGDQKNGKRGDEKGKATAAEKPMDPREVELRRAEKELEAEWQR